MYRILPDPRPRGRRHERVVPGRRRREDVARRLGDRDDELCVRAERVGFDVADGCE